MKIPTSLELRPNLKAHVYDYTVLSDQKAGLPKPPNFKQYDPGDVIIDLPDYTQCPLKHDSLVRAMTERKSNRIYTDDPISLIELSFLLYYTQGLRGYKPDRGVALRVVPSAGCRHPFETYLACLNVEGLEKGVYRYLPQEHKLLLVKKMGERNAAEQYAAALKQPFAAEAAVTFFWACVPYRSEWRYPTHAQKVILIDSGHVCQNLYLACEAVGCGTCAIGAYRQAESDALCEVDGEDEFVVYAATVGKI